MPATPQRRPDLVPACDRCVALCCVAPPFQASEDFAIDKPAGVPCPNLTPTHRCRIHDTLADRGFPGCVIYDCYGAGQRATILAADADADTRHRAFFALRRLHEALWLLTEAARLVPGADDALAHELRVEIAWLDAQAARPLRALAADDAIPRARIDGLLRRVGEAVGGRRGLVGEPPRRD